MEYLVQQWDFVRQEVAEPATFTSTAGRLMLQVLEIHQFLHNFDIIGGRNSVGGAFPLRDIPIQVKALLRNKLLTFLRSRCAPERFQ